MEAPEMSCCKICKKWYWPRLSDLIAATANMCNKCARRGKAPAKREVTHAPAV